MSKLKQLLPYILGCLLIVATTQFRSFGIVNFLAQMTLFLFVVCIPAWRTERMSYVDIGWPWGLVVIGVLIMWMGEGDPLRVALVSGLYVFMGARMGLGALKLWRMGALARELPRYQYQAVRWEKNAEQNIPLARQVEVLAQGLANTSYLAMPAILIAGNPSETISPIEWLGFTLACVAFVFESIADFQKVGFIAEKKAAGERNRVCDVGLWRFSRHPNYFGEWMVWNGLIVMALPSLPHLFASESIVLAALLTAGLFFVSRIMYITLVYYTGAKPSEFYSVRKRPDYAEYQRTTNIFFPGPRRV